MRKVRNNIPVLLVLCLGITLSFFLFKAAKEWEEDNTRATFLKTAQAHFFTLKKSIENGLFELLSLHAFYSASQFVERGEFHTFLASSMKYYPCLKTVKWLPRVPHSQREAFEKAGKQDGFENFQITERDEKGNLTRANQRDEYFPVFYIEPFEGNEAALGFDLASDSIYLKTLNRAMDTGKPSATLPVRLVHEMEEEFVVLVFVPVYQNRISPDSTEARRKNLQGFLLGVYRAENVLKKAIEAFDDANLRVHLYDKSSPVGKELFSFYSEKNGTLSPATNTDETELLKGFNYTGTIDVADRKWLTVFTPKSAYISETKTWIPIGILAIGLFITGLLVNFAYSLIFRIAQVKKHTSQIKKANEALKREIVLRKEAEETLREGESRYRQLTEAAFEGVCVSEKGVLLEVNQALAELFGYERSEYKGMPIPQLVAPEEQKEVMSKILSEYTKPYETTGIAKDGRHFPVEVCGKTYTHKGQTLRVTALRDISGRKRLEEETIKTEKLESLGILAGGLAHDFNNLLTAILGNINLVKMNPHDANSVCEHLAEAEEASMRARDLTQQLLTFSKGGEPIVAVTRLGDLILSSVNLAVRGASVKCEYTIPDNLWLVEVDEGQISQVIHNLIINAVQAMPKGGIIKVNCENRSVSSQCLLSIEEGKYVKISVKDQGMGIPKEHLDKIFDPYFTTKERGSGLGLFGSYSIVKKHGGLITVKSEEGVGTVFNVYLPASEKEPHSKEEPEETLSKAEGNILFMDDDKMVRDVGGRMLRRIGYRVEFANNGQEAIEKYKIAKKSLNPFDAVVMDLTIPGGMGGKEAIQGLLEIDPDVKAVVSSGYSQDPIMADFKKYGFVGVLTKPYKVKDLSNTLQQVINKGKPQPH